MYIDLELENQLQPYVKFDWRLVAERGLRCYGHLHQLFKESRSVASCEICFLIKASRLPGKKQLPFTTRQSNDNI